MPLFNTLEYNGEEKQFTDWGIILGSDLLQLRNQAQDTFSFVIAGADIADDPVFDFEERVIIRSDRSSTTGDPDSFTAGVDEFTGKRLRELVDARPDYQGITYTFAGPWYDLEHTVFQQRTAGWVTSSVAFQFQPEVILFTKLDGSDFLVAIDNGEQIEEALQFLLDAYSDQGMDAPFQIGDIDPAVNFPSYIAKPMQCSDVIVKCLEFTPDVRVYFDYTTSPPTIHVKNNANLSAQSLALLGSGHKSVRIAPRPDLQARAVVINYKITITHDGQEFIEYSKDKYGPNGANHASDPEEGLRVIVETIDLVGVSTTSLFGALDCEPLAVTGGTQASKRAWWADMRGGEEKLMTDTRLRFQDAAGAASTLANATVVDEDGAAIDLGDYPNKLVDGHVLPWMRLTDDTPIVAKRAFIKTSAACALYDATATAGSETATNGNRLWLWSNREFLTQITLTNGETGDYTARSTTEEAEAIPSGVAQAVFQSLNTLQYEGNHIKVATSVSGGVTMAKKINFTGGRTEWTTMNAQLQELQKCLSLGTVSVSIGPARHLNAGEIMALFRMWRFRRRWFNPMTFETGQLSSGGNVEVAKYARTGNVTPGPIVPQSEKVVSDAGSGNMWRVEHDAPNAQVIIQKVDSSGANVGATGKITIKLADLGGTNKIAQFRQLNWKDATTCIEYKAWFLMTEAEAV